MNSELFFILQIVIYGLIIFGVLELIFYLWIKSVRKEFQWLITSKDEKPILSKEGLEKFIPNGYDSEIGWIRKPNTSGKEVGKFKETVWNINEKGSRRNLEFDTMNSKISCYGDSFTFCRQVNNNQTWEYELSKILKTNVQNFGVGNYGIDQSLLRLKRNLPKNNTPIVIMGVVPDTISRIMSCWKHYYEYGNTFAFKPRFILKDNQLHLVPNFIDDESKFQNYTSYLKNIQKYDFFYLEKFRKEKLSFPYVFSVFKNPNRNFTILKWMRIIKKKKKNNQDYSDIEWLPMKKIMEINLSWRLKLFKNNSATKLLEKIIEDFVFYCKSNNVIPVFVFLPQKDDLLFIKSNYNFLSDFLQRIKKIEKLKIIDVTSVLLKEENIDEMYSDENEYGGHYSHLGNKKIAEIFSKELSDIL